MKPHLEAVLGHHDPAPLPPRTQVDVGERHLPPLGVPPALDQLRLRPRLVDQVLRRVELARDQDLGVRRERHRRRAAIRHRHHRFPSFPGVPPTARRELRSARPTCARSP